MKDTKITIFRSLEYVDTPFIITLETAVRRIREGKSKKLIEAIRKEKDKEKRDALKRQLPAVLFAGVFKQRNKQGLKTHSGLMITDFDGIPEQDLEKEFDKFKNNPHVVVIFRSPSGKGFKAVVRIPPCSITDHERYFKAFQKDFGNEYFDEKNKDVQEFVLRAMMRMYILTQMLNYTTLN